MRSVWSLPTCCSAGGRALAAVAAAVLVVLALGWFGFRRGVTGLQSGAAAGPMRTTSLAILPFRNASGDPSLDWLGGSLVDMLRTDIGQSAQLHIVSSNRL